MSEDSDQLKDITEKIGKVMKYTDNDMNRAKQIVQGTLKDFAVIKGKLNFEAKGHSGIFLIFIHKHRYYLVDKFSLIQDSPLLATSFNLGDSWKAFFIEMNHALEKNVFIQDQVTKLNTQFEKEFSPSIISQMISKLESGDLTSLTIQMENICSYALGENDFFLQVDFEEMTSLEYEEVVRAAISERIKKKEEEQAKKDAEKKALAEQANEGANDETSQEKNRLILEGNAFVKGEVSLSPIKGKFISEIVNGDVISVKIKDASQKAVNIIKQLHLVTPEGKIKKTKGKVIYLKKTEKGFILFVQIAPLAVLEVMEEEEVKVECENAQSAGGGKGKNRGSKKDRSNMPIIIISSVITAIIVLILIVFVLS